MPPLLLSGFLVLLSRDGYVADARFRRYKMMQVSLWIMWCGNLTHSCLYLLPLDDDDQQSIGTNGVLSTLESAISFVFLIVYMCGLVGLLINSVQFGIDQMPDTSSSELSAFIHWYVFATCAGIWFPWAVLGLLASCSTPHPDSEDSFKQTNHYAGYLAHIAPLIRLAFRFIFSSSPDN